MNILKNQNSVTPPRARPIQYKAPLGTRWEKEKANAPKASFEFETDPEQIGLWTLGECVGKGASGRVRVARHSETGQMAAVKILPLEAVVSSRLSVRTKENKAQKHRNGIDKEIIMMKLMDHPNIVRILDVFEGDKDLFLVLEYVDGGELFDYLVNHGKMEPLKGLCYFKQIIYGLAYAHAFSIIHRDLKPENILIASLNPPHIKIADWGMAAFAPPEHHLETSCGSPHYASPEIVKGEPYSGTATDIWSCGVILFALMTGRLPFDDKNLRFLLQKVKSGKFEVPEYVYPEAADLIRRMLVVDVNKRISMQDILTHPFLQHATPAVSYVPAPSISELDRPLRSRAFVKQDLLSSLLVICAGASYDEVVNELLSPPGQGSLIKALYFLLAKHRERTLEEYGNENLILDKDGQSIRHYIAPPLKDRPTPRAIATQKSSTAVTTSQITASRLAPAPPSANPSLASPIMLSTEPSSPTRPRPPSPVGPRATRTSQHKSRPNSTPAALLLQKPVDMISSVQQGTGSARSSGNTRMFRPRTQTLDGLPMNRQRYDPHFVPPDVLHPGSARPDYQSPVLDIYRTRDTPQTPAGPPFTPEADVPCLVKPTVASPELQRAIDDIAGRFNVLVSRENQSNGQPTGEAANISSTRAVNEEHMSPKKLRLGPKKPLALDQQRPRNFSYSHPNKKSVNLTSTAEVDGVQDVHDKENRDGSGSYTSFSSSGVASSEDDSYMKIDPEKDGIPPRESRTRPKRGKRASQMSYSDVSEEHRLSMIDPAAASQAVVGELKGWFANLFNWKAQQYVLHSVDNCLTTRDEVSRLLQHFGCNVVLEDAQNWGVLRCRMDEVYDCTGFVAMKPVRFRIEFSPVLGYTHIPNNPLTTPRTGSSSARSSTKNMTPFASTLIMVQEKGALSTFKYIYQRLRAEWQLVPLRSPEIGGVTPMVGATPRLR